jgi:hypothetical protein
MRNGFVHGISISTVGVILVLSGCAARTPAKGPQMAAQAYTETPVPTVAASATPAPGVTPSPLSTRPIGKAVKATKGHPIGPIITFFGAARADGGMVEPESVDKKGIPTYLSAGGSGFQLVVEAQPGLSGLDPSRRVFAYVADDPKSRPDLEIETSRDMGDGSPAVCDRMRPNIGGIPGINPPDFAETQRVSDAINDFACRFETFLQPDSACTVDKNGEFAFERKESTLQFCMVVARAWAFPLGDTLLSVRLRDTDGNPGPIKQVRMRRSAAPAPAKNPGPTPAKK